VPCRTYAAKADFSDVKVTGGDYNNAALFKKFDEAVLYDGLVEQFEKFARDKKTLIFNVNVEHSLKTVEKLREAGYTCEHVDGSTPSEKRRKILADFKAGAFQILSNCSVLTTGYDEPSIEAIIVNRATMSLPLWLQMAGRGSRLHQNKPFFTLIDMGANCYKHGLWDDSRTWSLVKPRRSSSGVAPVKLCEGCEAMNHASARECKECGKPFDIKKKALKKAEFVEVNRNRGGVNTFVSAGKTIEQLKAHAAKMGYNPRWAYVQLKLQENKTTK
jgi:superfamily II DNA or RNA helicase